jgi:hypothetical protein
MIEIPLPLVSHRRLFSPLAFRQRGRTLYERGIRSQNQRQQQAKTDSCSGHRPAIQSPNPARACRERSRSSGLPVRLGALRATGAAPVQAERRRARLPGRRLGLEEDRNRRVQPATVLKRQEIRL